MDSETIIIAIDAGGTKSRVVVGSEEQIREGRFEQHEFGPGNFKLIGVDGVRTLALEIKDRFQIGKPAGARVIGGFAGAGTDEAQAQVLQAFEESGFVSRKIIITSDANLLLASLKNDTKKGPPTKGGRKP